MMKGVVLGLILGVGGFAGSLFLYFSSGRAPVAVTDPPLPFEEQLAHSALHARLAKESGANPAVPADEPNLVAGARVYQKNCAVCHGVPGAEKTAIAAGMYPPPPELFVGTGVTDDPAGITYWKAAHGIRLTGMPGFEGRLSETELWQVSQLLAHANALSDSAKKALSLP